MNAFPRPRRRGQKEASCRTRLLQEALSQGCGCPRAPHPPPACEHAHESRPDTQPLLAELRGVTPFRFLTRAPHPGPRGPRDPPVRTPDDAPGSGTDSSEGGGSKGTEEVTSQVGSAFASRLLRRLEKAGKTVGAEAR